MSCCGLMDERGLDQNRLVGCGDQYAGAESYAYGADSRRVWKKTADSNEWVYFYG